MASRKRVHMGIRPLRIFAGHGREKLRARASRPSLRNRFGDGRRTKETTGTRKETAAKRGNRRRDFFPARRRLREARFLQTLSVKVRFCIRYRLRTGKKFVFGTRSRLRTGKKFTPPRRRAPEKKLCIFSVTDGEKVRFLHTLSVTDGKNNALGWYFFGARFCRSALGRRPPRSDPKNLRREKKALEREVFPDRAGVHFSFFSCGDT